MFRAGNPYSSLLRADDYSSVTVTMQKAFAPFASARITAVPAVTPVTVPSCATVATEASLEVHTTGVPSGSTVAAIL